MVYNSTRNSKFLIEKQKHNFFGGVQKQTHYVNSLGANRGPHAPPITFSNRHIS